MEAIARVSASPGISPRPRWRALGRFFLPSAHAQYRQAARRALHFTLHEIGNAVNPLALSPGMFIPPYRQTLQSDYDRILRLVTVLQKLSGHAELAETRLGFFLQLQRLRWKITALHKTLQQIKADLQEAHGRSTCNDETSYPTMVDAADLSKLLLSSLRAELDEKPKGLLLKSMRFSGLFLKVQRLYALAAVSCDFTFDPFLRVDVLRIGQVLSNLVKNARESGATRIRLRCEPVSDTQVRILVEDNGRGIPPALIARIWGAGFSTKRTSTNRGMGLALCQELVEAHGGSIEAESVPGKGTCFEIRLPIAANPKAD